MADRLFVAWTMVFALGGTAVLAGRLDRAGLAWYHVAKTLLSWQAGVVALGLFVVISGPLQPVQGNLAGVRIRSVRLGMRPSQPLIEGDRAFVVTTEGLHVIDLDQAKLVATVVLPDPEPDDLGLSGERFRGTPLQTGIRRSGPEELTVSIRWPYLNVNSTTRSTSPHPALYVYVLVNTSSMTVTSWEVNEDDSGELEWKYPYGVTVGPYEVKLLRGKSSFAQIKGAGADVQVRLGTSDIAHITPFEQGVLIINQEGMAFLISLPASEEASP